MDESTKENLIEQFRAYLETSQIDLSSGPKTDLFSLFTELAALRNEVKLESRQVKTALDMFKETFDTIQSSHEQLTKELERCHKKQHNPRREITRPLLLAFLEVYDRLEAGMMALNNYTPSLAATFCKREHRLIQGLQEGQAMTLRRVLQLLTHYQVRPFEVLKKLFDPQRMRAVEVDFHPKLENGIVTGELRKGFMWGDEVLRLAEVKVNKK